MRVKLHTGDWLWCGMPLALSVADYGASRPPIDRKNRFMTSVTANWQNMYAYVLIDGQYYFVQKCNLDADAETQKSNKFPRGYKCVSVKFAGVKVHRLLWLDQPIATEPADRPRIQLVRDILRHQQLQLISHDQKEAETQLKELFAALEQTMDGDGAHESKSVAEEQHGTRRRQVSSEVSTEDVDEIAFNESQDTKYYTSEVEDDGKNNSDEDEDEVQDSHGEETEDDEAENGKSEAEQSQRGEDEEEEEEERREEFDYSTDFNARDEMVPFSQMTAALAEKDGQIAGLEV